MADTQTFKQHSFSTENDQVEGYRRLSQLAVWSVPLGFLSALAMVSPLLWFVPLVAVTFALGGLRQISRSNDLTGRRLALLGLGLAVLFGTWGMTWTLSRQSVINRQSREHASQWLDLMRNREYMQAHQLTLGFFKRTPVGTSLEEHYAAPASETVVDRDEPSPDMPPGVSPSPFADLNDFKGNGIPKILVAADGDFEFQFARNLTLQRDGRSTIKVEQVFRLTFPAGHEPRIMDVKIKMKRTVDDGKAYWQVGLLSDAATSS